MTSAALQFEAFVASMQSTKAYAGSGFLTGWETILPGNHDRSLFMYVSAFCAYL